MNNKKFLGIILILILAAAGAYAYLGGFAKPEVSQVTTSEIFVAGKAYQGPVKSEAFGKLFQEAGKLVAEGAITGDPGNIFYNDPEKHQDSINAFVGVIISDPKTNLPAGYEVRSVPAGKKAVQGTIDAHSIISPSKVYDAIFKFAKDQKITLQDYFIERYPNSHRAEILVLEK
jgi:effector-binding domain-containing protein